MAPTVRLLGSGELWGPREEASEQLLHNQHPARQMALHLPEFHEAAARLRREAALGKPRRGGATGCTS